MLVREMIKEKLNPLLCLFYLIFVEETFSYTNFDGNYPRGFGRWCLVAYENLSGKKCFNTYNEPTIKLFTVVQFSKSC